MLDLLGIPYLTSSGEAEAYCAVLNSKGLVHGVLTDDTDALLYGASIVYKNISTSSKVSILTHHYVYTYHSFSASYIYYF